MAELVWMVLYNHQFLPQRQKGNIQPFATEKKETSNLLHRKNLPLASHLPQERLATEPQSKERDIQPFATGTICHRIYRDIQPFATGTICHRIYNIYIQARLLTQTTKREQEHSYLTQKQKGNKNIHTQAKLKAFFHSFHNSIPLDCELFNRNQIMCLRVAYFYFRPSYLLHITPCGLKSLAYLQVYNLYCNKVTVGEMKSVLYNILPQCPVKHSAPPVHQSSLLPCVFPNTSRAHTLCVSKYKQSIKPARHNAVKVSSSSTKRSARRSKTVLGDEREWPRTA